MARHYEERIAQRSYVVQVLYQAEMVERDPLELVDEGLLAQNTRMLGDYGRTLLAGITEKKDVLDQRIAHASSNWSIDRMPAVDRSILRLAAYEALFMEEIPVSVAINEAVNLAKSFGGDDSPRFVNGILGKIANVPKAEREALTAEPVVHTTAGDLVQPTEAEAVAAILEAIASNEDEEPES